MRGLLVLFSLAACSRTDPAIRGDDASSAPASSPAERLVGRWVAEGSGRHLEASLSSGVVSFRVTDAAEWKDAYQVGETRFALTTDGTSFTVIDRYRPFELTPAVRYGPGGRAACTTEVTTDQDGKLLRAELLDGDTLLVDFARIEQTLIPDSTATEIVSCGTPKLRGRIQRKLRRAPAARDRLPPPPSDGS